MLCPQPLIIQPIPSTDDGFTLIEVMVALVILTFGILAVLGMQTTAIRGGYQSQNLTEAACIGANKIEEIVSQEYAYIADQAGNNSDTSNSKYTVTWDVNVDPDDAPDNTTFIHLVVTWTEGGRSHEVAYDFLKAEDI